MPAISFDNTFARELPKMGVPWQPAAAPHPTLVRLNRALAEELHLDLAQLASDEGARMLGGGLVPEGAAPLAQAYAGHQFGGFSPQLGDGRALLLGEVIDAHGRRRDIAYKGSGATPFSRGGDGKSALGPALREYILGEAMFALGIPTTRALAVLSTGEMVRRERMLPGAVLTRVAASHIRVGTFQFLAARGDTEGVRALADYVIARHYPELAGQTDRYFGLLLGMTERQAALIARWMHIGFIHGVMNTDNMALSGETIDYGPCAFLEAYDPRTVFSSIDEQGRYAYGNQPYIARWNLARFAETLLNLIDTDSERAVARATEVINTGFSARYDAHWLRGARAKLGLRDEHPDDQTLAHDWLALLEAQSVDYTLAWRRLAECVTQDAPALLGMFKDQDSLRVWLAGWRARLAQTGDTPEQTAQAMCAVNPLYIPRNQRVEEALTAAVNDADLGPFEQLLEVLARPFEERPGLDRFAEPAPVEITAQYQTFCGT
jgi:serine/tyrosine/threonine adenylyltransferase